jgi:hypothetical protein
MSVEGTMEDEIGGKIRYMAGSGSAATALLGRSRIR